MANAVVDTAVEAMQRALESVVQDAHHAFSRSVYAALDTHKDSIVKQVRECVDTQQREILQAASSSQPSFVEQAVNFVFGNEDGLVNWMADEKSRNDAINILSAFKTYVLARRGNDCRIWLEKLLPIYMRELGMTTPIREGLAAQIFELKKYILPGNSYDGDTQSKQSKRHRIILAINVIRNVGNKHSHEDGDLSDGEILEICGSVAALGRSLAPVAQSLRADIVSESENLNNASTTPAAIVTARPSTPESTVSTNGSPAANERSSSEWLKVVTTTPALGSAASSGNGTGGPNRQRIDTSRFQFLQNHPMDLPDWPSQNKMKFARMQKQKETVPRANLCDRRCDRSSCPKSHSYLEVMRYNPLFKVFKCDNPEHYRAREGQELMDCVCVHVDVPVDMEELLSEKQQLCRYLESCGNDRCRKSHSFEEICWYNPLYKTKECEYGARCLRNETCWFYHSEKDRRKKNTEDDYVGQAVPIPHIERTHIGLAQALEELRAAGNSP